MTPDSRAILLTCGRFAPAKSSDVQPLKPKEWNDLALLIRASPFERPGALLGRSAGDLATGLDIALDQAERIAYLMEQGPLLDMFLDRLADQGIWTLTRVDPEYPARLRERLKGAAPLILHGAGPATALGEPGLAVAGSRNVALPGVMVAEFISGACALSNLRIYTGGAKGVDQVVLERTITGPGTGVGVLADSLSRAIRDPRRREAIEGGRLTLVTPYSPDAGFAIGNAMGRNKIIYALADWALVIASDLERGGTWTGAIEAIEKKWVPVFVLDDPALPGNQALIAKGANRFSSPFSPHPNEMEHWFSARSRSTPPNTVTENH